MGVLRLSLSPSGCGLSCSFCDQVPARGPDGWPAWKARLDGAGDALTSLHLTGHDSVASPHLLRVLRWARERGLPVTLSTPGHLLGRKGLVARLAAEGLTELRISLHGGRRATHDGIAGRDGAWVASLTALREAAKVPGLTVVAQTTACTFNADELPHIQHLASMAGVRRYRVRQLHAPHGDLQPIPTGHALAMWHHLWREAQQEGVFMTWRGLEDTWNPARQWSHPIELPISVRPHADDGHWVLDEMAVHALRHRVDIPAARLGLRWNPKLPAKLGVTPESLREELDRLGAKLLPSHP